MCKFLVRPRTVSVDLPRGTCSSDVNRGHLLEAEFPQIVLSILRSYVSLLAGTPVSHPHADPASALKLQDLKIIKTAFGFLLNAGLDYSEVFLRSMS